MHISTVFIVLVVFVSMYRGEVRLDIDKSVVCEGTPVTLTCTVNPPRHIRWNRNAVTISSCILNTCEQQPDGYSITIDFNTGISIVYINSTSLIRDGGEWTCIPLGSRTKEKRNLTITAPASSTIKDKSRLLFTDGMVTEVTCYTGTIDSTVSFTWYIDSIDNALTGPTSGVANGGTASILQITSTKQKTNKKLYCSATNQCGTGNTDNVTLDIRDPLIVHIEPPTSPYKIIEGNQLTFTCDVNDSNPQPTSFTWSKDGGSITGQRSSVFSLTSVQRSQAGQYTCAANNGVGTGTSTSVQVDVLYPPTVSTPSIYKILESSDLSITCSGNPGNPTVTRYIWTGPGGYSSTGAILNIPDIKRIQTGVYRCTGTNTMVPTSTNIQQTGRGTSQTTIDVLCSPRQYPNVKPVTKVIGNISETVQLSVSILACPEPTFTWYRLDNPININNGLFQQVDVINSTNIFISTLTVHIQSSDLYGDYKVNISNDANHTILTVTLTTQSVPDLPSEFILDSLSHSSICIKLKRGFDGGDTQKFIFEHSIDNTTWITSPSVKLTKEDDVLNGCIGNLNPDTEYFVRVITSNKFGSSKPVHLLSTKALRTRAAPEEDPDESNILLIVGVVFTVLVIIIAVIIVIIFIRQRRQKATQDSSIYNSLELNTRSESLPSSPYSNLDTTFHGDKPVSSPYETLGETRESQPVTSPYSSLDTTSYGDKLVTSPYETLGETRESQPVTSPYSNLDDASGSKKNFDKPFHGDKPMSSQYENLGETCESKPVTSSYSNLDDTSGPYVNSDETSGSTQEHNPYINVSRSKY